MNSYYDGLNLKLLNAIPASAHKVLELGCANGRLGQRYKELNPHTRWIGIDINETAVAEASRVLDETYLIDVDTSELTSLETGFDVIVIGDLLEHLKNPERVLDRLYNLSSADAVLVCCLPNMAHLSVVERLISGDFTYDEMGLLDRTHARLFSPSSAVKTFLDSGWLPDISDQYDAPPRATEFLKSIVNAASILGIPSKTALGQLSLYQMIITCKKWKMEILKQKGPIERFSVIVPVNKPWQYNLNILKSPGLKEVKAEIIPVFNSQSAAHAYETGALKATHPWKIFVHQDVYFPAGTGLAIARHLGDLSSQGETSHAVGFAGLAEGPGGSNKMGGMLVDRKRLFSHPVSDKASSLDEFAVALHSEAKVRIDPDFGWHLWATDLCRQSIKIQHRPSVSIINVPLFHNSINDFNLPEEFNHSVRAMFQKYPEINTFATLCGKFSAKSRNTLQNEIH